MSDRKPRHDDYVGHDVDCLSSILPEPDNTVLAIDATVLGASPVQDMSPELDVPPMPDESTVLDGRPMLDESAVLVVPSILYESPALGETPQPVEPPIAPKRKRRGKARWTPEEMRAALAEARSVIQRGTPRHVRENGLTLPELAAETKEIGRRCIQAVERLQAIKRSRAARNKQQN